MSHACTSICWLLHQGQMIIILHHSTSKKLLSCKLLKCTFIYFLSRMPNAMYKRNLLQTSYSYISLYMFVHLPVFSSFASRALIVQFEQLTRILLCITLSNLTFLIWIWYYTTMKEQNCPNLRESTLIMIYEKLKYLFFPDRRRFLVVLNK